METFWIELARLGRHLGLDPLLIYRDEGVVPESIRSEEIPTAFRPFLEPSSTLLADLHFVREHRVRFVYLTDRPFWDPRYALLRGLGVRRIVTHDHVPGDRPEARGIRAFAKGLRNRVPLGTADLQVAVSPFVRQRAIRCGRIPPSRVAVVQNGIRPIPRDQFPAGYASQAFGIPRENTICVMAGRAHRYKRVDFLIEVAKQVRRHPDGEKVTFLFCGDGPDLEWLKSLAAKADLDLSFIFAGRRNDLPAILSSCDMAVHPSQGEAFSLAIIEYMSAGLPVLVPALPSVSQAVVDGQTGFVYPDDDSAAATKHILRLHLSPELRTQMGNQAARTANEKYSLDQMISSFRDVMAPLLPK
jgi:glycosyltransferase involved in cell wall biosynthesis